MSERRPPVEKTAVKRAARAKAAPAAASAFPLRELRLNRRAPVPEGSSLVQQAVVALRRRILSSPDADRFLGSEEQLMTALGVSRPTFRQAARLLEHEQLLTIKRGIGGGFFARAPSAEAVSRMAAIFLNAQGATMRQMTEATTPALVEAARLLATNPDATLRGRLLEFMRQHTGLELLDIRSFTRVFLEYEQLLGKLCGNPAIALMIDVMRGVLRDPRHGKPLDRERQRSYTRFCHDLAQSVADADSERSARIVRSHVLEVRDWLVAAEQAEQEAR